MFNTTKKERKKERERVTRKYKKYKKVFFSKKLGILQICSIDRKNEGNQILSEKKILQRYYKAVVSRQKTKKIKGMDTTSVF